VAIVEVDRVSVFRFRPSRRKAVVLTSED